MKKTIALLFTILAMCFTFSLHAQDVKGSKGKAMSYLSKGDLEMAKAEIDAYFAEPKNEKKLNKSGKLWVDRAKIYKAIALSSEGEKAEDAIAEVNRCLDKVKELEKEESAAWLEAFGYNETEKNALFGYYPIQQSIYDSLFNKAVQAYQADDLVEASKDFQLAFKVKPDTLAALYAVYSSYNQDEPKLDVVKEYSRELIKLDYPDATPYTFIANIDMTQANEMMLDAKTKADSAKAMTKLEGVLDVLNEGREAFPDNTDLLNMAINIYIKTDKVDEAISSMEEAAAKNPEDKQLFFNLGVLYDRAENVEKSVENYKKAIEIDPEYYDALFNVGATYFSKGNKMVVESEGMKDMRGNYEEGKEEEGKKMRAEGEEFLSKAAPYFEKIHEMQPDERQPLEILGRIYSVTESNEDRLKEISDMLRDMPEAGE